MTNSYPRVYSVSISTGCCWAGFHTNTGRSFRVQKGHNRSVSQPFLKEKVVAHSESLKICANGAAKVITERAREMLINKRPFPCCRGWKEGLLVLNAPALGPYDIQWTLCLIANPFLFRPQRGWAFLRPCSMLEHINRRNQGQKTVAYVPWKYKA